MADRSGNVLLPTVETGEPETEDTVVEVELPADEEEAEDDEPPSPQPTGAEPRPSRKERRNARVQRFRDETEQARRELEAERQRTSELSRRLTDLESRTTQSFQSLQSNLQRQTQGDPLAAAKRPLLERRQALTNEWASLSEDEQRRRSLEFQSRNEDIEQELTAIRARALQPSEADQRRMAVEAANRQRVQELHDRYPEVVRDQRAMAKAQAFYHEAIADGKEASAELADECFRKTREWQRGGRPDIPFERSRTGGIPNARAVSRDDGKRVVRMTGYMRQIAELQYPHLPPEKAHQAWAKNDHAAYAKLREEVRSSEKDDRRSKA